ncbi:hypothetical protein I656_02504 [Geobacillus sp. WSUCF1]|nr:hypothetical protein I656_02504 [Geobacillus sp. WSUCF1]
MLLCQLKTRVSAESAVFHQPSRQIEKILIDKRFKIINPSK